MIETDDLRLVPNTPEQLLGLIEHPERYEQLAGFPAAAGLREFFASDDVSPDWLASLRTIQHPDPWQLGFAIVHRESRCVIGSAGFKDPPDSAGTVEVAYGIVPAFEGRGYATQAAKALVAYAVESGLVQILRAHTLPMPNGATKVLKKCGFEFTGDVVDPDDGPVWRWERAARAE